MAEPEPDPLEGLTDAASAGLARVAIRTRESGSTLSAWRLSVGMLEGQA